MKRWITLVLTIMMSMSVLAACSSGGQKEITIYTALEDDIIESYTASFKEKHPDIKLNMVRVSTGVITAKLLAEKDNPVADVVWGVAATSLLVLDQNHMLEGYDPQGIDRIQDQFKDTNSPAKGEA